MKKKGKLLRGERGIYTPRRMARAPLASGSLQGGKFFTELFVAFAVFALCGILHF